MRFFSRLALPASLGAGAAVLGLLACSDDGNSSFGPNYGDLPQHGSGDAGADGDIVEIRDGSTDGPTPGCTTGSVAILSGDDSRLIGSVDRGRGFAVALLTGGAAFSTPAIVGYGDGFIGVSRGAANTMQAASYDKSWSKPVAVGVGGIKGPPTLAVTDDAVLHVIYSAGPNNDHQLQRSFFDGQNWNNGENVTSTDSTGAHPSFGTESAGAAPAGNELAFAENGGDNGLYTRVFTGAWSAPSAIFGAGTLGVVPATPQIIPISGKYDLLMVFVKNFNSDARENRVSYVLREAATKSWKFQSVINKDIATNERVQLARTRSGDVLLVLRSQDGKGYVFQGAVSDTGVAWADPSVIGGESPLSIDSTPGVATGVCGDDAIMALSSVGKIQILRLKDGAWSAPETIEGAAGYRVAIATRGQ